jgi:hypothetical protein
MDEWWSGGATYEKVGFDGEGETCVIRVWSSYLIMLENEKRAYIPGYLTAWERENNHASVKKLTSTVFREFLPSC